MSLFFFVEVSLTFYRLTRFRISDEEGAATFELRSLENAKTAVEKGLRKEDINAFLANANTNLK